MLNVYAWQYCQTLVQSNREVFHLITQMCIPLAQIDPTHELGECASWVEIVSDHSICMPHCSVYFLLDIMQN